MARKQKHKKSNGKRRRSSTATKSKSASRRSFAPNAEFVTDPVQRALNEAGTMPDPVISLAMFEEVVSFCRENAADYVFDSESENPWTVPAHRRYLQAMYGVATSHWRIGNMDEALKAFHELFDADDYDNLNARYWVAAVMLGKRQFQEAAWFLERWDDPTDIWVYAKALANFAVDGDSDNARAELQHARQSNEQFLDYLLGDEVVKADAPIGFQTNRKNTHSCARLLLPAWRAVPGAMTWARQTLRVPLAARDDRKAFPREQLLALPQEGCDWQLGLRCLDPDKPAEEADWILVVADVGEEQIRAGGVIEGRPTPQAAWSQALSAFLKPMDGEPARPMCLEVPKPEFRKQWRDMLQDVGVDCVVNYHAGQLDQLLEGMGDLLTNQVSGPAAELPDVPTDFDPLELPLADQAWQVDFFHQPCIISNDQVGVHRPWSIVVLDQESGTVVWNEFISGEPSPDQLWSTVAALMVQHSIRPKRIEVTDSDGYDMLRSHLADAGVACVMADELPALHEFCLQMAASFDGPGKSALADGDGVTREAMDDFYHAAAGYFRQSPWEYVPGEVPIEINLGQTAPRYAIVLGRTGVTLGMVMFEDWQSASDLANGRRTIGDMNAMAVIFDEEQILAAKDIYLQERNGWPIATPEAYPAAMRFRPGYEPGAPSLGELQILTTCLEGLPGFLTGRFSTSGSTSEFECRWCPRPPSKPAPSAVDYARSLGRVGGVIPHEPRASSVSAVTHINRRLDTYYLHEGRTKTGKPKYFFSKKTDGQLCNKLPDGYEVYENPRGQVYCRLIKPKLITDAEVESVREAIVRARKNYMTAVDVKGKDVIVYEHETPVLKFRLCDKDERLFEASRWCFRGSIDGWIELFASPQPLEQLAKKYCRHIGEESFFELM